MYASDIVVELPTFQYSKTIVFTPDNVVISIILFVSTLVMSCGSIDNCVCVPIGDPFNVILNNAALAILE